MKQQTAVVWLFLMLNNPKTDQEFAHKLLNKAKEIEKEQIENAWDRGRYIGVNFPQRIIEAEYENNSEQYYNELYKK